MTHDELRESLPAFALGALDADERQAVASHLETCDACKAELVALERVVGGIGLDAAPVTPPASLRARVLDRVAAEQRQSPQSHGTLPFAPKHDRPLFSGSRLALAASVTLAIGASFYALALRSEITSLREMVAISAEESSKLRGELVDLRRNWAEAVRVMDVMKAPDMMKVDLKGQVDMPGASGRAFWSRTGGIIFTADKLPPLPAGRVYQFWVINGKVPTGAGTFTPNAQGAASLSTPVAALATPPDAFAVTIEPAGGSPTPTMPIVMVGARQN